MSTNIFILFFCAWNNEISDLLIGSEYVANDCFCRAQNKTLNDCYNSWGTKWTCLHDINWCCIRLSKCYDRLANDWYVMFLPALMRHTLLVRMAAAVSPAPSAFPTRTHAAPCIPNGIWHIRKEVNKNSTIIKSQMQFFLNDNMNILRSSKHTM